MKFKSEIAATVFILALALLAAYVPADPPEPGATLAAPAASQQQALIWMFDRFAQVPSLA